MKAYWRNFGRFEVEEDLFALLWHVKFPWLFCSQSWLLGKFVATREKRL
jgi:hypothetical protein